MAVNSPNSPRQKMINLMYLVFIAMLAMNVSVDVLDGFKTLDDSLQNTSSNTKERNLSIMDELTARYTQNPEKAQESYRKGLQVRLMSDSLSQYIGELKLKMVRKADGKNGNINHIKHKEDHEAASMVMLSPINGEGERFRKAIDQYRESVTQLITDSALTNILKKSLNTQSSSSKKSWEASLFDKIPLAGAITMLTKIENDVRNAEREALNTILQNIDGNDFRVNRLQPHIIPQSNIVIQGSDYNAQVILSAEDSTYQPHIVVNGENIHKEKNGFFSIPASHIGTFPVNGYIEMNTGSDAAIRYPFNSSYTVIEPVATIAPTLMNVLYAGIDNELSISVPGIAPQQISATITNGSLSRRGNTWTVRPQTIGQVTTITVSAQTEDGKIRRMASKEFKVRRLPNPTPYIAYNDANGNPVIFQGGSLSKSVLMHTEEIRAAIDDGILSIPFKVISFRTLFIDSMGNAIPETSDGNRFSTRQKEQIKRLSRGSSFFVAGVRATGPDGSEREIAAMEVRVK